MTEVTERYVPSAMPNGDDIENGAESGDVRMLSARVRGDRTTTPGNVTHSEHWIVRPQPCHDLKRESWAKWDAIRATLSRAGRDLGSDVINPAWEHVLDRLDELHVEVKRQLVKAMTS